MAPEIAIIVYYSVPLAPDSQENNLEMTISLREEASCHLPKCLLFFTSHSLSLATTAILFCFSELNCFRSHMPLLYLGLPLLHSLPEH